MEKERKFIYLNNAATSWPKPPDVISAMSQAMATPPFSGRTTGEGKDYLAAARESVSRLLCIPSPEHVVFTHSATDSLNILIAGMVQKHPRCHALTTALDHNSVLRPLHEYKNQGRIEYDVVPFAEKCVLPEDVEAAIRPDTRFMVMTHGSNVLGSVQDIKTIGEVLHENGIYFIVDGAQTAGHVLIELKDMPVDCFVFTGHKGLFGAAGTGGFYIRDPELIPPVRFGGTGTDSALLDQPLEMPERFEVGTHNYPGLAALAAGVSYIESIGIDRIEERAKRQASFFIDALKEEEKIRIYNEHPELPIVSCNICHIDNDDVGFILSKAYHIISRTGLHCAPLVHQKINGGAGCIRFSFSWFTTDEECELATTAMKEIAAHAHH